MVAAIEVAKQSVCTVYTFFSVHTCSLKCLNACVCEMERECAERYSVHEALKYQ